MHDAPERIWAQATACDNWEEPIATPVRVPHFHEYVRADTIADLEEENQRLREALVLINRNRTGVTAPSSVIEAIVFEALSHTEKEGE